MRYLGLALFAEGPTDHRFLRPVLRRLCEQLCAQHGQQPVEVGDVAELHTPSGLRDEPREQRIFAAGRQAGETWNILFVHTDGEGDPDRARRERAQPAMTRLLTEVCDNSRHPVAVVPVRETEAWALVDPEALRAAFGTNLPDHRLGLPARAIDLESLGDPKQALDFAFKAAVGKRRRRVKAAVQFEAIGERVSLDRLGHLPAFALMADELTDALTRIGYLVPR